MCANYRSNYRVLVQCIRGANNSAPALGSGRWKTVFTINNNNNKSNIVITVYIIHASDYSVFGGTRLALLFFYTVRSREVGKGHILMYKCCVLYIHIYAPTRCNGKSHGFSRAIDRSAPGDMYDSESRDVCNRILRL